ncbi:hypothetical protein B0H63DRAFT_496597 [Podospora didyma]|uniref:CENP-V/GFA domain-containing protein n=1 Tax=Podospora didyma TaxID=330526 RepID=A0AAE0N9W0_9PEZI|nr:hypothetical protein B0H63DRAFT_496597 [Podospora didyma]
MSFERPLRGSCNCGRNRYIIQFPKDAAHAAQVLFNSNPSHRISQASPLASFLRVPLQWVHSTTLPFFPDETSSMIHKAYISPYEQHTMRHFCGFCGTPLSYWSEEPRSEADFIQLTLGSLLPQDLADLGELGFLPGLDDTGDEIVTDSNTPHGHLANRTSRIVPTPKDQDIAMREAQSDNNIVTTTSFTGRETVGALPWLDTLTAGSRLGTLRTVKGYGGNHNGTVRVEWEIVEWSADDDDASRTGKRKLDDREGTSAMEGVQQP